MKKKIWAIRPEPNFTHRLADFLSKDMVALGWPGLGDLGGGTTRDDIRRRLRSAFEHYAEDVDHELAVHAGILDRFVNVINEGDLVIVPNGEEVYVSEVSGPYVYRPELDGSGPDQGYPHWRPVKYINGKRPFCKVSELPLGVRRAIDCRLAVFSINAASSILLKFLGFEEPVPEPVDEESEESAPEVKAPEA
jgi:predicted Mrr-cat superfamily restriction endonuclease